MADRPTSEQIELAVCRELQGLERRLTVEDERLLQAVREAAVETGLVFGTDVDVAEVGARLALRLICRLGVRYVGEARMFLEKP